jgi:hypothetical protein
MLINENDILILNNGVIVQSSYKFTWKYSRDVYHSMLDRYGSIHTVCNSDIDRILKREDYPEYYL